ncbi:MAG: alpha/beta hydrolase family protein [Candidatus Thorarchaeota archaeon]|jgi:dipeptidyl aminopeptidase/acylaminoacyl peptidase
MNKTVKIRPTVKDLAAQHFFGHKPYVSPDCSKIAYLKAIPNLKTNGLDVLGYIYDIESGSTHRYCKGSWNIKWLDDNSISCLKTIQPSGNNQIHVYRDLIGEPIQITDHQSSILKFEPFGEGFVFTSTSGKSSPQKRVGNFNHVENNKSNTGLFYVSYERALQNRELSVVNFEEENVKNIPSFFEITKLLDEPLAIDSYVVAPEKNTIYLNCQKGPELVYEDETTCYKIELQPNAILEDLKTSTIDDALSSIKIVELALPKGYKVRAVSPDGSKILLTGRDTERVPEARPELWILDESDIGKPGNAVNLKCITEKIDRYHWDVYWTEQGIYMSHMEESRCIISRIEEDGEFVNYSLGDAYPVHDFTMNKSGHIAFRGFSPTKLIETYYGQPDENGWKITRVTSQTEDSSHLDFGTVESIKWTSKDGTEIEGILRKPSDFDPKKKYPLIVQPHGGPRQSSHLSLQENEYYRPVHSFLARGILILQPNYRGGIGKGRAFMELNHDNLGVGDMWDIESGIDYLISLGFVDETRIGSMGGSQGGYLSAFGGMHTDRFVAVNVMAGVSSWYIYYVSSDNYHCIELTGTPHEPENREVYVKSAPIAAIDRAKTPMLIQHGEKDERISVVSAQELYRALKHKGVPTELFTYPDKGHGFISPQDNYAMMLQVYRWFCHYLLDEELDFFKDDF